MPEVRKVEKPLLPRFFSVNQFRLEWNHFTQTETQPWVGGTPVHADVSMNCELDFVESGNLLIYQDTQKKWRLGKISVNCVMIKNQSKVWAVQLRKNSPQQNSDLLKHERVHVELAERHARYVFQQLRQIAVAGSDLSVISKQLIDSAFRLRNDHWKKLELMNTYRQRIRTPSCEGYHHQGQSIPMQTTEPADWLPEVLTTSPFTAASPVHPDPRAWRRWRVPAGRMCRGVPE